MSEKRNEGSMGLQEIEQSRKSRGLRKVGPEPGIGTL